MEVQNRVLLVEDEAPLRRSLEKYLRQAGYAFDSCSSVREALVLADIVHYAIVIAEYHLPDANGSILLDKLKRIVPDTATIVISSYDFEVIAEDLVRVGVHSFLKKPFDLAELEAALSSARSKARISLLNLDWKAESESKAYQPQYSKRELSEAKNPGGVHVDDRGVLNRKLWLG